MFDLIIIGGATAGLTSAIYAIRKKLKVLLLTKQIGGQSLLTDSIENFPGFENISGAELVAKIEKQVKNLGAEIKENAEVASIEKKDGGFLVKVKSTSGVDRFEARALILASGRKPRLLNVPGEEKFLGKGVSVCSICDAPLFQDKDVAVVGGGNAGLEAALDLTKYAEKIYVLEANGKIRGDEATQEQLRKTGQVEFQTGIEVQEIKGNKFVESLIYKDKNTGEIKELKVGGVFINIGQIPATDFLKGFLELNQWGEIAIDPKTNQTSVPGVFAAGDATDVKYKQCIIAAGEGAKAALSAYEYISKLKIL